MNNSELLHAIDLFLSDDKNPISHSALKNAYLSLQKRYADLKQSSIPSTTAPIITDETMRLAYLLSRMPATYAVASTLIRSLTDFINPNEMHSLLDLGTGTGSVLWAFLNSEFQFPKITALDHDPAMLKMAKQLLQYHPNPSLNAITWVQNDLNKSVKIDAHDVVTISYALIEQAQLTATCDTLWSLFNKVLIITEPGTPKGFSNILMARDYFIKKGAYIAAPCSHRGVCPMKDNNWCHFVKRLERSAWQKSLKNALLGYEDEAYSYLIITKFPVVLKGRRILSPPVKKSGHVILDLCEANDAKQEIVTRRDKMEYKIAKKKKWGDVWEVK